MPLIAQSPILLEPAHMPVARCMQVALLNQQPMGPHAKLHILGNFAVPVGTFQDFWADPLCRPRKIAMICAQLHPLTRAGSGILGNRAKCSLSLQLDCICQLIRLYHSRSTHHQWAGLATNSESIEDLCSPAIFASTPISCLQCTLFFEPSMIEA